MNSLVYLVGLFVLFGAGLAFIAFLAYRRTLRHAKGIERGLKMVPLLIHLPPPSDDTDSGSRSVQEVMREKVNQAQVLYDLIAGTAQGGFKSSFYGQRHIAFEIVASNGLVHYFAAVPIALVEVVEQAIVTAYPGARLEEVEDHNIFNPQGRLTATVGGELVLKHEAAYPIGVIEHMERDPMEALINSLYKLQLGDGAAVQIMLRPARPNWVKRSIKLVANKRHTRQGGVGFGIGDIAKAAVKAPETQLQDAAKFEPSKLEEEMLRAIEDKTKHPGYEVLVRVLASSSNFGRSQIVLRNLVNAFALFEAPGSNGFQFIEARDIQGLVTAFIFRFFPPELVSTVLNSVELAALFHLPDAQFTATTQVERQQSKQVDGPINMPPAGLLLGYNFYRGVKKEIRLSPEDRRRHAYIVGQTGTGKSTMLENLAVQDMLAGNGFAFIDPHGDAAEKLLSMVPKERAEDVIYFNPGDMEHPLGLNIFEYSSPEQKDFLIQESLNMLYKLYDPGKTGIIGPRFEHWYRNAALTLMADPHGASFIELPKVFTDAAYLKNKFKFLQDPTVIDFWTKEMAQTSDYHKSEMLGWFVSKFGAFQTNDMMRNIIGQTHSSFDLRDIMDNKKMLIVNLSKGRVGELNSQLLGMVFVIKIQAAAMSRANVPEDQRPDFCLYVDEFQNFSTDSFASILSEARKYHLNLIVANQFIGQLTDEIRDAVFGNIGSILSYRTGPEDAEFLVKQFQPIFDQRDLVNLPNHNAIMKLLIGGLPSQPFSITALPPLGVAHPEMGIAIQQLSAAKYGSTRSVVEADIFARLQNQPAPVVSNTVTTAVPSPAAAVAPAPAPALQAVPAAAVAGPAAQAATAPPTNHSSLLPAAATAPQVVAPVAVAASPAAPTASAPLVPPAPSPKPPAPVTADGLAISQLRQAAQTPAAASVKAAPMAAPSVESGTGSIADVVKMTPPPARPAAVPSPVATLEGGQPVASKLVQIEARETDGRTSDTPMATPPSSSVPKPLASPPPQSTPKLSPVAKPLPKPALQPVVPASQPPPPAPSVPIVEPAPRSAPVIKPAAQPAASPTPPPVKVSPPVAAASKPGAEELDMPSIPPELAGIVKLSPTAPRIPHGGAQVSSQLPKPPNPTPSTPPKPKPASSAPPLQSAPKPPSPLPPPRPIPAPVLQQPQNLPSQPVAGLDGISGAEPVLPPDQMASAHIQLHHHSRASENPFSDTAQQALAGQSQPTPESQSATKPAAQQLASPSLPRGNAATVDAYVEAAAPKPAMPPPIPISVDTTFPDAPPPRPGEIIAPKSSAAQSSPPKPPSTASVPATDAIPPLKPLPQPDTVPVVKSLPQPAPAPTPVPAPSTSTASPAPKSVAKLVPKPSVPMEPLPPTLKAAKPPSPPPQPPPKFKPKPPAPPKVAKPPEPTTSAETPVIDLTGPRALGKDTPSPPADKPFAVVDAQPQPDLKPGEVYVDENGEVIQG